MNKSHIELLQCIQCRGQLRLSQDHPQHSEGNSLYFGVLACTHCLSVYPIIDGVGVFFTADLFTHYLNEEEKRICHQLGLRFVSPRKLCQNEKRQLAVALNWSYEWNEVYRYSEGDLMRKGYFGEEAFSKFIPIPPRDFENKVVVLWGVGRGREAYHVARHNPRLLVVNDIGDEIYGIRSIISKEENLLIARCDLLRNPLAHGFADYSICDHALHHVVDHSLGFQNMLAVLKTGGIVGINVYSYENNFLMTHVVEPLKPVIHKFPLRMQRYLAVFPAVVIFILIQLFYLPAQRMLPQSLCKMIPLFEHMVFWSKNRFKFFCLTCFDLLHAPISYHFKKQEIQKMADTSNVRIEKLMNTNKTTWSMLGRT